MSNHSPINPPDELLEQWQEVGKFGNWQNALTLAYRAGADQELEACCEWLRTESKTALWQTEALRAARRPTPQPPADGEVAELCAWLRNNSSGIYRPAARAADLLERLASDNAGLEAAADSLWAENVSLLDNCHD